LQQQPTNFLEAMLAFAEATEEGEEIVRFSPPSQVGELFAFTMMPTGLAMRFALRP
jgi:hypothetical protein